MTENRSAARHCERSEANHELRKEWIASSLALFAMTA
jgi:hypothetical protein